MIHEHIKGRLERLRRAPRMWATCKEAFLAIVTTYLDAAGVDVKMSVFYTQHVPCRTTFVPLRALRADFTDAWAQAVVDQALAMLQEKARAAR